MEYKSLFSPMKIGECEIKNRIVFPPILMGMANLDGTPTEKLLDYYEEKAKGGTGLIMTEITRVNNVHGAAAYAQLAVSKDYNIAPLKELADRIHRNDSKIFVQLHHPGRQNVGLMVGTVPLCIALTRIFKSFPKLLFKIAPSVGKYMIAHNITFSAVAPSECDPAYFAEGRIRALKHREIKKLITQFIDGAERCKKAGIDGVELHASHGYLIQQFLSPHTNFRTDEYGGSFDNRLRFLTEIVTGIKERLGSDYPVVVRLTADECYSYMGKDCGYKLEDGVKIAKQLEKIGVDAIDVSSAGYDAFNYWLEPTTFELGWRKHFAKAIKDEVSIPVMAANLIRSAEQAETQINEGYQDFASLGRPQIADPHIANKIKEGKENQVRRCICCLYCIESMQENAYFGDHGYCAVNPTVGHDIDFENLPQDGEGRKIAVVGSGVAGLMCAETLARRGFDVTVFEKENEIGGQILLASAPPKKEKLNWCIQDLRVNAEKFGAKILTNTLATEQSLASLDPYAIIVATGAFAIKPRSIKGVEGKNVFTTTEILDGTKILREKSVLVVGSGLTGLETAHMLAEDGNTITVCEMADKIAPGTWFQHLDDVIPKLKKAGTRFLTSTKLASIDETGAFLEDIKKGKTNHYAYDAVVLSLGSAKNNKLYEEIKDKFENVYVIGDAEKVGRIANATRSAYDTAMSIK